MFMNIVYKVSRCFTTKSKLHCFGSSRRVSNFLKIMKVSLLPKNNAN